MADGHPVDAELHHKTAGATPLDAQLPSPGSSHSKPNSSPGSAGRSPQKGAYWFACSGEEPEELAHDYHLPDYYWFAHAAELPSPTDSKGEDQDGRESVTGFSQKDREERIRLLRERQSEERQRKLEELKQAALHAQRVREQQEDDRRRKIEELRSRDLERRAMVEERKKQIWEADRERREAILRKNMEREARFEAKRNASRSSIGFAFGSCTPRLLDSESGYFSNRRATSQTNVMLIPATNGRPSAEREIDGVRKRPASTFGADYKSGGTECDGFPWSNSLAQEMLLPPLPLNLNSVGSQNLISPKPDSPLDGSVKSEYLKPRADRFAGVLTGSGVFVGEDLMTKSLSALGSSALRGRRKTDLTPTIPVHDSPRTHSPGRAFSMTRLDQLAQPRHRPMRQDNSELRGPAPTCMNKTKSMSQLASRRPYKAVAGAPLHSARTASKSMTHLAVGGPIPGSRARSPASEADAKQSLYGRSHAQSLWHLPMSTPPRPTRASRMRANALQKQGISKSMMHLAKKRIGDEESGYKVTRTTPSSPSRPNSSLSQQSLSSHASQSSTVSLRARTSARRPRPVSIAGTAPDQSITAAERQGRSTERKALMPTCKPPRAKSAGADRIVGDTALTVAKPPPAAPRRMPATPKAPMPRPASALPKEKPKIPPKPTLKSLPKAPTPKQSPTIEHIPAPSKAAEPEVTPLEKEERLQVEPEAVVEPIPIPEVAVPSAPPLEPDVNAEVSLSKPRITTEEEAKAAIAERRRLAREQAERQAELERQREEELRRQEEERIRLEEEERKRWESEQDMLRKIEEERLQKAIDEQRMREEEEMKRREEEARQKAEREDAERKSREEQEKLRRETEERLRKEEEERAERRKRVEAIMSRTRGKGSGISSTPVTTPTKQNVELIGTPSEDKTDVEKEFPGENEENIASEPPPASLADMPWEMPASQPDLLATPLQNGEKGDSSSIQPQLVTDVAQSTEPTTDLLHTNGYAENGVTKDMDLDLIVDSKNADRRVNDFPFAEFDVVRQRAPLPSAEFEQLIDLSTTNTDDFLNNADNVNSNIGPPFIAFEDNFTKKQETNTTDLLS